MFYEEQIYLFKTNINKLFNKDNKSQQSTFFLCIQVFNLGNYTNLPPFLWNCIVKYWYLA